MPREGELPSRDDDPDLLRGPGRSQGESERRGSGEEHEVAPFGGGINRPEPPVSRVQEHSAGSIPTNPDQIPPAQLSLLRILPPYTFIPALTETDAVVAIKVNDGDIQRFHEHTLINGRSELYKESAAPVIRFLITVGITPDRPLVMESFVDISDPDQRGACVGLASNAEARALIYNELLVLERTLTATLPPAGMIKDQIDEADQLRGSIPDGAFNFDAARRAVMWKTTV